MEESKEARLAFFEPGADDEDEDMHDEEDAVADVEGTPPPSLIITSTPHEKGWVDRVHYSKARKEGMKDGTSFCCPPLPGTRFCLLTGVVVTPVSLIRSFPLFLAILVITTFSAIFAAPLRSPSLRPFSPLPPVPSRSRKGSRRCQSSGKRRQ